MVSIVVIGRTHGVGPVLIRGERIENIALCGLRRYINGSKFP
jgi:hypothetical protein